MPSTVKSGQKRVRAFSVGDKSADEKRAKCTVAKHKHQLSQQSADMSSADQTSDQAIAGTSSSGGTPTFKTPAASGNKLSLSSLNTTIQKQNKEIDELKLIVKFQQSQIEYLMSLFGITECPVQLPPGVALPSLSSSYSTRQQSADGQSSSSSSSQSGGQVGTTPSTTLTYAKVTSNSLPQVAKQFTKTIVSAVYRDLDEKGHRARNVVINGLLNRGDDIDAVRGLLADEFGQQYDVVKVRRLGRPRDDRIQPLLVVLDNVEQAASLIRRAKLLRQSTNEHIRRFVFINADVTKAEALASFQKRCERRERQKPTTAAPGHHHARQRQQQQEAEVDTAPTGGSSVPSTSSQFQFVDATLPSASGGRADV